MSDQLTVTGGSDGIGASYDDMITMAGATDDLSAATGAASLKAHAVLMNGDLTLSAVLDPVGAAKAVMKLGLALDGPTGLTALALRIGVRAEFLRGAVLKYRATDRALQNLADRLAWGKGYFLPGLEIPVIAAAVAPSIFDQIMHGHVPDLQRTITDDPRIIDDVSTMLPGLVAHIFPSSLDVRSGARGLGLMYPDGDVQVIDGGIDLTGDPGIHAPPRNLSDVMIGLAYRNFKAQGPNEGQIDVRTIEHADGSKSYIVDLPGTKTWHFTPFEHNRTLNDLGTNVRSLGGEQTAYEKGVFDAMERAGIGSDDAVMLVGHSQGGIIAAQVAADSGHRYNVTHVVTAGSPVGRTPIPEHVNVLSIENKHDIVPHLDGAENPDRANRTTVVVDHQTGSIGGNHGLDKTYVPAADAVDQSRNPSTRAYVDNAKAFTDGTAVITHTYLIVHKEDH